MFPGVWLSTCGKVPDELWTAALSRLSPEEIQAGLEKTIELGEHYPPSLPEFMKRCKPLKRENAAMYRTPPSHQLEKKLSDEEKINGRSHVAAMKAKLRGGLMD